MAPVLSFDASLDLALLRVPESRAPPTFHLGDSAALSAGDEIVAIGGGVFGPPVFNAGEVIRLDAQIAGVSLAAELIETTAQIESGDSGGPLVNGHGVVVGVMVAQDSEDAQAGMPRRSYAISLHNDDYVVALLEASRAVTFDPGFLCLRIPGTTSDGADRWRGCMVSDLHPDGLGSRAGLQPGDLVVAVDGASILDLEDPRRWYDEFVRSPAGSEVEVQIQRDGLTIKLVAPSESGLP